MTRTRRFSARIRPLEFLLLAVTLGACSSDSGDTAPAVGETPRTVNDLSSPVVNAVQGTHEDSLECELLGFPCTWNDVAPEIVERTHRIGEVAGFYSITDPNLDSIADFLEEQSGMAVVEVIGTGVRFRLEGGRPHWIFLPSELDHHRKPPESNSSDGQIGPAEPSGKPLFGTAEDAVVENIEKVSRMPGRYQDSMNLVSGRIGSLLDSVLGVSPLFADSPSQVNGVAADKPGDGKKALILSPFEFEWPGTAGPWAARARLIRDFREKEGGKVTLHADMDKYGPNPDTDPNTDIEGLYQSSFGNNLLSGQVQFDDFLHWDEYNLVLLASHGTRYKCNLKPPVGGEDLVGKETTLSDPSASTDIWCPLIWAGRAKQASYGSYIGVETMTMTGNIYDSHPGLTRIEAEECVDKLDAFHKAQKAADDRADDNLSVTPEIIPEPTSPGGKPCRVISGQRDQVLVGLWTAFFKNQYPNGLKNIILFLGACQSGINDNLLKHFTGGNGSGGGTGGSPNVAVMGFDESVNSGDAWHVATEMLKMLDKGYDSQKMIEDLKGLDRTKHLVGKAMDFHPQLPDSPANVVNGSSNPTHGRDVVELVDPDTGAEFEDGDWITLLGALGDGKPDKIQLGMHMRGIDDATDVDAIKLELSVDGRAPIGPYKLARKVREGVMAAAEKEVELGFDVAPNQTLDLEIRAELEGGGKSRWRYDDLVPDACVVEPRQGQFAGEMTGPLARTIERHGRGAFAKILGSRSGGWMLQMHSREPDRDLWITTGYIKDDPRPGGTATITDSGYYDIPGIAGKVNGIDRDLENDVRWHTGEVHIVFTQVRPQAGKPFTWVCGTIEANLVGMKKPPEGSFTPILIPATFSGRFWAEWYER